MRVEGCVAVVTGASSGIGEALAIELGRRRAKVVLAARNLSALERNAARVREVGGQALAVKTDVADREQMRTLMRRAWDNFGRLDLLINNAGISPAKGIILDNREDDVRATFETNFMGSLYGLWEAAPYMERAGGGVIAFVTSIIGKRGVPRNAAYCASKFAVQGLTESIRPELRRRNIRIVTTCPAGVATPFYSNNGKEERRGYRLHPADKIARGILRACEREQREALLTFDAWLLNTINNMAPSLLDAAMAKAKGV